METCIYYKNGGVCGYYSDDETKEFCNMSVCSVEKTDCHKDIKLEKLIGRKVKCLFTDGESIVGVLYHSDYYIGYQINDLSFRKSCIKKIVLFN